MLQASRLRLTLLGGAMVLASSVGAAEHQAPNGKPPAISAARPAVQGAADKERPATARPTPATIARLKTSEGFFPTSTPPISAYVDDSFGFSALRVEWDPESGTWGVASAPDPIGAGLFGIELPSDEPLQIVRPDGSVMIFVGRHGLEYVSVRRRPDGKLRFGCSPLPGPPAGEAADLFPEK